MEFFRGFVPTKNKECLMKFRGVPDDQLMTLEQVKNLPEYAGILAPDVVLIDADDEATADALWNIVDDMNLKCRVYETTRGIHVLLKDPDNKLKMARNGTMLATGLKVDLKLGLKNGYEILKFGGKIRPVVHDIEPGEEYATVPPYLLEVRKANSFVGMQSGDARNSELFTHILKLQTEGFTVGEIKETLRVINSSVFDEPMPDDELEVIMRDESFSKVSFFEKGKFMFHKFENYLIANDHVKIIEGQLHVYDKVNGTYKAGADAVEGAMRRHLPNLKASDRGEVVKALLLREDIQAEVADSRYIQFTNGILDVIKNEMIPHTPDLILMNPIPHAYNPKAKNALVDKTLDKMAVGDKDIRAVMEEMVGYTLYRRNELGKAFILTGDGSNGKSTFLAMTNAMLSESNCSYLELDELSGRFDTATLYGKLANIGDDISDDFIHGRAVSIFKKIVTGDPLKAEHKGEKPFSFKPQVKLLFSANAIPRIRDKSNAVMRRLVIVPFDATFSKSDPDYRPYIKYELLEKTAMERFIYLGVQGLRRVLENQEFTQGQKLDEELQRYKMENDSVLAFCSELELKDIIHESTTGVYRQYDVYCRENGLFPLAMNWFSRKVCDHFDVTATLKRVDGKRIKIFTA